MDWDWDYALEILPTLWDGLLVTLRATVAASLVAMVLGLIFAIVQRSPHALIRIPLKALINFIRNTPLLVQLYVLFFILPQYGISMSAFVTGVVGLGLHYSAYTSEVYRGGIESVEDGQWEAARALNLPTSRVWLGVVLPQAIPRIVPALGNYIVSMFKETALLSAITVTELLSSARAAGTLSFRFVEPMTIAGLLYLALSYPSTVLVRRLESRLTTRGTADGDKRRSRNEMAIENVTPV